MTYVRNLLPLAFMFFLFILSILFTFQSKAEDIPPPPTIVSAQLPDEIVAPQTPTGPTTVWYVPVILTALGLIAQGITAYKDIHSKRVGELEKRLAAEEAKNEQLSIELRRRDEADLLELKEQLRQLRDK